MADALIGHFLLNPGTLVPSTLVTSTPVTPERWVAEGPLHTPDGRDPRVRSVWQPEEGTAWRLVTAVPLTRR